MYSHQPQLDLRALPAFARIAPGLRCALQPFDLVANSRGLPQFEQIALCAMLRLQHRLLVAVTDIATDQPRPTGRRQTVEQRPQARHTVAAGMLLSAVDFHAQYQPQRSDKVRVAVVTRTARFLRIIPTFGAFLVPVQRLDRRRAHRQSEAKKANRHQSDGRPRRPGR